MSSRYFGLGFAFKLAIKSDKCQEVEKKKSSHKPPDNRPIKLFTKYLHCANGRIWPSGRIFSVRFGGPTRLHPPAPACTNKSKTPNESKTICAHSTRVYRIVETTGRGSTRLCAPVALLPEQKKYEIIILNG